MSKLERARSSETRFESIGKFGSPALEKKLEASSIDLPDSTFGSGTFGRVLSAGAPRHMQLGLKLLF